MKLNKFLSFMCFVFTLANNNGYAETLTFPKGEMTTFVKTTEWHTDYWNSNVEMVFDCTLLGQKKLS
jgi:hypothetical protein